MSPTKNKREKRRKEDLEPVCVFLTRKTIKRPDEKEIEHVVSDLLSSVKIIRTPNPLVWILLGRWKPDITNQDDNRTDRLIENLNTIVGNVIVSISPSWTNLIKYQELAWQAWRELFD